jgi:cellulose synthase/poly-beta-1,6-N-acetylglucosamine synthase-like glycosyltransferase
MNGAVLSLEIAIDLVSFLILLPASIFCLEIIWGLSNRPAPTVRTGQRPSLAVLVPAHNEASVIRRTVRSVSSQLNADDRLVVIADNCSDDTASISRREGAEVIERTDSERRGKGYALDFGVRHLEKNPPAVVIVVDADCQVERDAIDRIACLCAATNRPVQALYLMQTAANASLKMRVAAFAWLIKNQVRPNGLLRMGFPCQLTGTGMAFSWSSIRLAKLATGHIVEDMKLGLDLARSGSAPLYCPDALVTSEFPISESGAEGQRTRWEHGHLSVILSEVPALLLAAVKQLNPKLLAMTLDLSIPPLALLALLVAALWSISVIFLVFAHLKFAFVVTSLSAIFILAPTLAAWNQRGRDLISSREFAHTMLYPFRKIPIYVKFLVARQMHWVRSKRDGE